MSFLIHFKFRLFACKALKCLVPRCLSELLHPNTPSWWLRSADQLLLAVTLHVRQASSLSHFILKVFFKQTSHFNFFGFLWICCIYTHFLSFLCGQCILSVLSLNSLSYLFLILILPFDLTLSNIVTFSFWMNYDSRPYYTYVLFQNRVTGSITCFLNACWPFITCIPHGK